MASVQQTLSRKEESQRSSTVIYSSSSTGGSPRLSSKPLLGTSSKQLLTLQDKLGSNLSSASGKNFESISTFNGPASESNSSGTTSSNLAGSKRVAYTTPIQGSQSQTSGSTSGSRVHKIVSEVEEYSGLFGEDTAQFILDTRERERRELHELNDRLASYLERMRILELQNKDLESLKARWLQDVANVKSAYERELNETQRDLEDTSRNRAMLEAQINKLQAEFNDIRKKLEDAIRARDENKAKVDALIKQLHDAENELNKANRRVQTLEDEVGRLRNENNRLQNELQKTKADLDRESMKAIDYENQIQALLKKMESMRREYEQEVTELRNKETMVINADQYKSDLANAIRDIRKEFDSLANKNKGDLETWYVKKVQELQTTETNKYKDESNRLLAELESVRSKILDLEALNGRLNREIRDLENQLQREKYEYESTLSVSESHIKRMLDENRSLQEKLKALFDTNQSLYAEIAIYRKLLDNEEHHLGSKGFSTKSSDSLYDSRSGLGSMSPSRSRQLGTGTGSGRIVPSSGSYISKQDTNSQSNFQRASKGNVEIADVSPEGKYIKLENLSMSKDENMGQWKLVRLIDNKREQVFTFPSKFILKPGKTVTVWARNQGGTNNYVDSFVYEGDSSWGIGANVVTIIYNSDGEERGSFTQVLSSSQVSTL